MQDPKNELTFATLIVAKSQNNNTGGDGLDIRDFVGKIAADVNIGAKTVGDADGTIAIRIQHSSTNNISNATNYGSSVVNTTSNTPAVGQISIDTRDCNRYIFAVPAITGTNTPAYPVSVRVVGVKQVQG